MDVSPQQSVSETIIGISLLLVMSSSEPVHSPINGVPSRQWTEDDGLET